MPNAGHLPYSYPLAGPLPSIGPALIEIWVPGLESSLMRCLQQASCYCARRGDVLMTLIQRADPQIPCIVNYAEPQLEDQSPYCNRSDYMTHWL